MIRTNPDRTDILVEVLMTLWEASVRATHRFLTEEDIYKLVPFVRKGLLGIETLIVTYDGEKPVAFMGIDAAKIGMLFVSPEYFGKGFGKELVTLAINNGAKYVDVNEQNPQAAGFYRHLGFEVFERTESDEQGNPFPLLKMRLPCFSIRPATIGDIAALKEVFRNTVLTVNRHHYSQAEVEDWASCGNESSKWKEVVENQYFLLAENSYLQIVGFSSITSQGYLHLIFVHKDFQSQGIATKLLKEIEQYAKDKGITKITSEVSLTARPFFEKRGYTVEKEQKRQANQLRLTNFIMVKQL